MERNAAGARWSVGRHAGAAAWHRRNPSRTRCVFAGREWPSQAEEEALPLFLDGLSAPEPSDAELELRRRQLVAELRQKDESRAVALAKLKAKLYGSHPYKLEPSVQSLSGLSRKAAGELFRRSYGPSQMTLAIVGDIEPYAVFRSSSRGCKTAARPPVRRRRRFPPSKHPASICPSPARAGDPGALAFGRPD